MPNEAGRQHPQHTSQPMSHCSSSGNICGPAHLVAAHAKRMQQSRAPAGAQVSLYSPAAWLCRLHCSSVNQSPTPPVFLLNIHKPVSAGSFKSWLYPVAQITTVFQQVENKQPPVGGTLELATPGSAGLRHQGPQGQAAHAGSRAAGATSLSLRPSGGVLQSSQENHHQAQTPSSSGY